MTSYPSASVERSQKHKRAKRARSLTIKKVISAMDWIDGISGRDCSDTPADERAFKLLTFIIEIVLS